MADKSRYEDSYGTRNYGGANKGVLDLTKANGEVVFFSPKPDNIYKIDIISYIIKSKHHPRVADGKWKIGETDYRLDIFVHNNIGPSETMVVCPKNTYGKPCPICEEAERARREGRQDDYKALKAKRIVYYNVIDKDEPTKIKIFKVSHFLFEKELIEEAKNSTEDGSYVDFANEKKGYSVQFRGSKGSTGTTEFTAYKGFKFFERKEDLSKWVAKAHSFDDMLIVHDANKLLKIMNGDDDDVVDEEEAVPEWVEEKTEAPVEEVTEEVKEENPCPSGYTFGEDNDKYPECENCPKGTWRACAKANG